MSKSLVVWTLGAIVIGALLLFGFRDGADAATWKLIQPIGLDCGGADDNEATPADNSCTAGTSKSTSATADLDSRFLVEAGHTNYNKVDTMVSPPSFNVALDASIPNGAAVGTLITTATLSLLNGPCVSGIPVNIRLFDASTDITNTIDWVGDGSNWATDSDGNGLPDAADRYPAALNKVYNNQRPLARYYGHVAVQPGAPPSNLNMITFAPGVVAGTSTVPGLPRPEQELNASVGYVSMIQLDNPDPTAPSTVSSITDFCTPLDVTARLWGKTQGEGEQIPVAGAGAELSSQCGNGVDDAPADGAVDDGCYQVTDRCDDALDNDGDTKVNEYCVSATGLYAARTRVTNPTSNTSGIYGSGTHIIGAYSQGNRDADADGLENGQDSCPTIADGRETPAQCAPGNVLDEDADTVVNDGCGRIGAPEVFPVPNNCGDALDQDADTLANDGCPVVQVDGDGDGLGTACDPTPAGANNDPDGDLYLNRQDNCPINPNPDQLDTDTNFCNDAVNSDGADESPARVNDGCPAVGAAETACTDALDNDSDGSFNDGCPLRGFFSEFCVATDYGTCSDSIGNVCDANPTTPDGDYEVDFPRTAVCIGAADADSDGWCDATETLLGSLTASAASVPEYKGLDYAMVSGSTGSCSNLEWYASTGDALGNGAAIDDDGDTLTNAADAGCGAIGSDTDQDGVVDASDNCVSVYNPDQTNTDTLAIGGGDASGDACDLNDDGDGLIDTAEWTRGSDARNPFSPFMLDIDGNGSVQGADASALKAWIGTGIGSVPAPSQVCLP